MYKLIINDILDELRDENNRLLNENKNILNLLQKYRKGLLNLHNICVFNENSNIRLLSELNQIIESLDKEFNQVFHSKDNFTQSDHKLEDDIKTEANDINYSSDDTNNYYSDSNIEPKRQKCLSKSSDKLNDSLDEKIERKTKNSDKSDDKQNLFICNYRGQRFRSREDLRDHLRSIHNFEMPSKCQSSKDQNHNQTTNDKQNPKKKTFHCKYCDYSDKYKRLVREHSAKCHGYVCPHENCKKRLESSNSLYSHITRKHSTKTFKCPNCDKCFKAKDNLNSHSLVHSLNPKIFKCDEINCNFQTIRRGVLLTHKIRIHSKTVNMIECDYEGCTRSFRDVFKLRDHKKCFHSDRKFLCEWPGCDQAFKVKHSYENHSRTHLAARQYVCNFEGCAKSFKTSACLCTHRQSHIKKYVCSWPCCTERFSSNPLLTAHLRKHQNLRPFKCYIDGCVKDFYIKPHLDHHIRTVHKTKPIPFNSMKT